MSDTTGTNVGPFHMIEIHDTDELRRVLKSMGITPANERDAHEETEPEERN